MKQPQLAERNQGSREAANIYVACGADHRNHRQSSETTLARRRGGGGSLGSFRGLHTSKMTAPPEMERKSQQYERGAQ